MRGGRKTTPVNPQDAEGEVPGASGTLWWKKRGVRDKQKTPEECTTMTTTTDTTTKLTTTPFTFGFRGLPLLCLKMHRGLLDLRVDVRLLSPLTGGVPGTHTHPVSVLPGTYHSWTEQFVLP